jgi:hypothetical protein
MMPAGRARLTESAGDGSTIGFGASGLAPLGRGAAPARGPGVPTAVDAETYGTGERRDP